MFSLVLIFFYAPAVRIIRDEKLYSSSSKLERRKNIVRALQLIVYAELYRSDGNDDRGRLGSWEEIFLISD